NEESPLYSGSFSAALANFIPLQSFPENSESQEAVILFTSGTTGIPKGVVLSHGALIRSGQIIDSAYGWRSNDVFLGMGGLHTMSGLRNPCIAALQTGVTVLIPAQRDLRNPMAIMDLCVRYKVTILNAGPAFLAFWSRTSQKTPYFQTHHLRMVMSTGSALHSIHQEEFEKQFGCPVF